MSRRWVLLAFSLVTFGCSSALGMRPRYAVPAGPRDLDAATPLERAEYVRRAQVWHAMPIASLDLLTGPDGDGAFAFEQSVTCTYAPRGKGHHGRTRKANCALSPDDVVKVKYGSENGEIYGEVAGTRLFWALGFGTDRQYPVRVTCEGCGRDPWKDGSRPGTSTTLDPAIIERPFSGKRIEVRSAASGWAWWELESIDERAGGAPRAQVDALRLLAAFVQHSDNKDEQQLLACEPGGEGRDAAGNETCARPFLATVDLGVTFGRGGLRNKSKFTLRDWSSVSVWDDPARCVASLKRSFTGTMGSPRIGEAGRAFLAGLLGQLSERQIRDLFTAARADRRGERIQVDGVERLVRVDDWVAAFERKRAEIVDHRCPE